MPPSVFGFWIVVSILQGCAAVDDYGSSELATDRRDGSGLEVTSSAPPANISHMLDDGLYAFAYSLVQAADYIADNYPRSSQQYFDEGLAIFEQGEDYPLAFVKFHKAADLAHFSAQYRLALMYQRGIGVADNIDEAHRWFRESAVHGYMPAQYQLAMLYYLGLGVRRDLTKAYAWFSIASSSAFLRSLSQSALKSSGRMVLMKPQRVRSSEALLSMQTLEEKLTTEQVLSAQAYARQCISTNYQDCE